MTAVLRLPRDRATAAKWIAIAPEGTTLTFKKPRRSLPQNDRLHAMLTRLAAQHKYHGIQLDVDDWKLLFLDALNREMRAVPSLDGRGFVNLGRHTSKLSVEDFTALMDLVEAYAAQNGVDLGDE